MGKIYSQAQGVVAWLGRARNNSDPVMRHLNGIGDIRNPTREPPSSLLDNVKKAFNQSTALEKWCNRTYWQRMWIVQEIMLNHQVLKFITYFGMHCSVQPSNPSGGCAGR